MKAFIFLATLTATLISNADTKLQSTYTSINTKNCVVHDSADLHKNPEIDFAVLECPGLGGYQPMIRGSDLRYPLSLVFNGKEIELTRIGAFHDLPSDKLEWLFVRVPQKDSTLTKIEYKALIHRVSYQDESDESLNPKDIEVLIVTRLNGEKTCPVGLVKKVAGTDMNTVARQIAARADTLKCMDLGRVQY